MLKLLRRISPELDIRPSSPGAQGARRYRGANVFEAVSVMENFVPWVSMVCAPCTVRRMAKCEQCAAHGSVPRTSMSDSEGPTAWGALWTLARIQTAFGRSFLILPRELVRRKSTMRI